MRSGILLDLMLWVALLVAVSDQLRKLLLELLFIDVRNGCALLVNCVLARGQFPISSYGSHLEPHVSGGPVGNGCVPDEAWEYPARCPRTEQRRRHLPGLLGPTS